MSDTEFPLSDDEMEDLNDWLGRYEQSRSRNQFPRPFELTDEYDLVCENCGRYLPCRHCDTDIPR